MKISRMLGIVVGLFRKTLANIHVAARTHIGCFNHGKHLALSRIEMSDAVRMSRRARLAFRKALGRNPKVYRTCDFSMSTALQNPVGH